MKVGQAQGVGQTPGQAPDTVAPTGAPDAPPADGTDAKKDGKVEEGQVVG